MRCKTCDYQLWNIAKRHCPECGEFFLPSDYHFRPGAVKFCCPHCGTGYFGRGEKGHLNPVEFTCPTCEQFVEMDEMVLLPAVAEDRTVVMPNPWTQRARIGFFKGFTRTIGRSMVRTTELMDLTPHDSPAGSAWWFGFVLIALQQLIGGCGALMMIPLLAGLMTGGGMPRAGLGMFAVAAYGAPLILWLILSTLWLVGAYVVLRVGNDDPPPMRRVAHGIYYSCGPLIIGMIPCLGFYMTFIAVIWWIVGAALMFSRIEGVSGVRAAVAALLVPVLTILAGVALWVGVMYFTMTAAQNAAANMPPPPQPRILTPVPQPPAPQPPPGGDAPQPVEP